MQRITKKDNKKNKDKSTEDKVAVIIKPRKINYLEYKYDDLGPDEVKVRMVGCGLDQADMELWEGREYINYPLPSGVPGREGWGIVEKAGNLTSYKEGEYVAVFAPNALSNIVICKHDQLYRLPNSFNKLMFPPKAFGYAINIFKKCNIQKGQTAAVLGNGFTSSLITYLITKAGGSVFKISSLGKDANALENFKWHETDILSEKIRIATNGEGCDFIIECTGTPPACDLATSIIKENGNLILARQPKDSILKINMEDPCGLDITYAHDQSLLTMIKGVDEAIDMVEKGVFNPDDFITKSFSFNELNSAFELLCNDSGENEKICILF